ncbi:alpha/beta fold hydrolase [Isachenkonia alkalipeptolytica]|uniref:Alpha/beta hydrolase n=1 Tax=Isachenkonia alkalipeptolytica TaxID=2565777 RepID=A0AA44BDR2_9CLOT|nr:alpha/beta hydrolase [Isachenkonia alkalipeptolytica]NBG88212.1 alpha/beta hydrolase [Isachenkonia alkalipeptolytica]
MIYKSKYGEIYYEFSGPEGAPVLALCHGVGMDHKTFEKQVKALEKEYRVIVWDMPGHGRSTMAKHDMRFTLMAADCLVELLDETGTDRAVLGGLSLGSFVIQHVLCKHPERVIATVHIGGLPLHPKYSSLLKPAFSMTGSMKIMPDKMFYRSLAKHRTNTLEARRYMENVVSKTGKDMILKITKDMGEDMLEGVPAPPDKPLLITYGEDDIYTRRLSKKWHKRIPGSQRGVIPKANHIANQDNDTEFNKILLAFLETIENIHCKTENIKQTI